MKFAEDVQFFLLFWGNFVSFFFEFFGGGRAEW